MIIFGLVCSSNIDGKVIDIARAYSDNMLISDAIARAQKNIKVQEIVGNLEPIDKLAVIEGHVIYTNQNNSVEISLRIKGDKGSGKLDIVADRVINIWIYKKINVRIKKPTICIEILKDSIKE